jgi:hypothetical protein
MRFDERVQAVANKGFTERQARFLTTVMLHSGVCVPRQYARFCGIVHGAKTRKFFDKLVRLGVASMHDCRHNRARIYHVDQRALYTAIGERDSTLRRRMSINRAIQRLIVLDAIVEDPDLIWLATADEKAAHLTALTAIAPTDLPHVTTGDGDTRRIRTFPERLPIGIDLAGRGVIVYVIDRPDLNDFRVFLERHAALLRALPVWTLRIVVPPHLPGMAVRAREAVQFQLMEPSGNVVVDEMRWYFEQLRTPSATDTQRLARARRAFATPRAQAIYRCWKQEGEAALGSVGSDALRKAVDDGRGTVGVLELGHRYGHLSPLLAVS